MKCKDCNVWGCQHRTSNAEQECVLQNIAGDIRPSNGAEGFLVPEGSVMTVDWSAFRREVAKDIVTVLIEKASDVYELESLDKNIRCQQAIEWADELIKQLKQE